MKRTMILAGLVWILFFSTLAFAQEKSTPVKPREKNEINILESADLARQISYALGYDIFKNVTRHMELDPNYFIMGVNDSHAGEMKMEKDQLREMLMAYQRIARQKQMEKVKLTSRGQGLPSNPDKPLFLKWNFSGLSIDTLFVFGINPNGHFVSHRIHDSPHMVDVGLHVKLMDPDFYGSKALGKVRFSFKYPGISILDLACGGISSTGSLRPPR